MQFTRTAVAGITRNRPAHLLLALAVFGGAVFGTAQDAGAVSSLRYGGLVNNAVGGATLDLQLDGDLVVSGLGALGNDGVSVVMPGGHGPYIRVDLAPGGVGEDFEYYPILPWPVVGGGGGGDVGLAMRKKAAPTPPEPTTTLSIGLRVNNLTLSSVRVQILNDDTLVDEIVFSSPPNDMEMVAMAYDSTATTQVDFGLRVEQQLRQFQLRSVAPPGLDANGNPLPAPADFYIPVPGHETLRGNRVELDLSGLPTLGGPLDRFEVRAITPTSTLRVRALGLMQSGRALVVVDSAYFEPGEPVPPWCCPNIRNIGPGGDDGFEFDGGITKELSFDLSVQPVTTGLDTTSLALAIKKSLDKATPLLHEATITKNGLDRSILHVRYDPAFAPPDVRLDVYNAGSLAGTATLPYSGGDLVLAEFLDDAIAGGVVTLVQNAGVGRGTVATGKIETGLAFSTPVQLLVQGAVVTGDSVAMRALSSYTLSFKDRSGVRVTGKNLVSVTLGDIIDGPGIVTSVGDGEAPGLPRVTLENYPNPFNPRTTFAYTVDLAGEVTLRIYDGRGRIVRTLRSGFHERGDYRAVWDGRSDANTPLASGVYYARLQSPAGIGTDKVVLMK